MLPSRWLSWFCIPEPEARTHIPAWDFNPMRKIEMRPGAFPIIIPCTANRPVRQIQKIEKIIFFTLRESIHLRLIQSSTSLSMKNKLTGFVILSLCYLFSSAQSANTKSNFTLQVQIAGQDSGIIILSYFSAEHFVRDTAYYKNGAASFAGYITEPVNMGLRLGQRIKGERMKSVDFFAEPGKMQMVLNANDITYPKITGSKIQEELEMVNTATYQTGNSIDSVKKIMSQIREKTASSIAESTTEKENNKTYSALQDKLDSLRQQIHETDLAYINTHPDSYISPYLMPTYLNILPIDSLENILNRFTPRIQHSPDSKFLMHEINKMKNIAEKGPAPDFSVVTATGKEIRLSELKGKKAVILDFWASWCGPCRAGIPHLKSLYKKYHQKGLEVIAISTDEKKNEWLKAISEDKSDIWQNVLRKNAKNNEIFKNYQSVPIPLYYLIDKEGRIIEKWEGHTIENENEMDKKLQELLQP